MGLAVAVVLFGLVLTAVGGVNALTLSRASTSTSGPTYNVTFTETGLPTGTNWSVHLVYVGCSCKGVRTTVVSDLSSIVIPAPNGTYRYSILRVPGFVVNGSANGFLNVSGAAPSPTAVVFSPVTDYMVEFTETGLPSGTAWTVHVAGNGRGQLYSLEHVTQTASGPAMNFSLPNGSYHYQVLAVNGSFFQGPSHGFFVVDGAASVPITVLFTTPAAYAVTFTETGLLSGISWSVYVHGWGGVPVRNTLSSNTTTITFYLPNGSYRYRVAEVLGYTLTGSPIALFNVAGAPLGFDLTFQPVGSSALYLVNFTESGLASGTSWSVRVAATHDFGPGSRGIGSANSTTLSLALQNGTYRYHVLPVPGYTLSSAWGNFTVAGASPATIAVTYVPIPTYTVTFNETGLPAGTNWSVLVRTQPFAWSAWPVRSLSTSNSTTITFTLPNGTYCYRVFAVHGWHLTSGNATGSFVVAGASPAAISFGFSQNS